MKIIRLGELKFIVLFQTKLNKLYIARQHFCDEPTIKNIFFNMWLVNRSLNRKLTVNNCANLCEFKQFWTKLLVLFWFLIGTALTISII